MSDPQDREQIPPLVYLRALWRPLLAGLAMQAHPLSATLDAEARNKIIESSIDMADGLLDELERTEEPTP